MKQRHAYEWVTIRCENENVALLPVPQDGSQIEIKLDIIVAADGEYFCTIKRKLQAIDLRQGKKVQ